MATHQGSGIVLKTVFDTKSNRVLRTIFDKRCIYYRTIADYIPPLFLVVNYEEAAFTRHCLIDRSSTASVLETPSPDEVDPTTVALRTDDVFEDNIKLLQSLLTAADCNYATCQVTFLRLETIGDFQRNFDRLYPLWSVGAGALIRLTFNAWTTRNRALKFLASNAANNREIYTVNYAANSSVVTIIDYLEPLFAYCVKMTKLNGHDVENWQRSAAGTNSCSKKVSSGAAGVNTTEMFEINFCKIDGPDEITTVLAAEDKAHALRLDDRESSYSVTSTNVTKRTSASQRKRAAESDGYDFNAPTTAVTDHRKKQRTSAVLERQRTMCGPLTVHDVRPYFSMLNAKRLSRLSLDQLDELPVLIVHCEKHFCRTTCCVLDRTDRQLTVMHVYYCWDRSVYELLTMFAEARNNRRPESRVLVAVSQPCSEDTEAKLKMLEDLKNVIWKDNTNTYIRLAINDEHDRDMVLRNFFEPLVFRVQRSTADMETEIKCSVKSAQSSGVCEMFRNSVTLDCSRLCNEFDPRTSSFAHSHRRLSNDSAMTCNGFVRFDQRVLNRNAETVQTTFRLLEHKQNLCARLVSNFRSDRILEIAFEMASELRLGLLDVFGLRYTDSYAPNRFHVPKDSSEDPVFNQSRVANYVFLETLLDTSMYFGGGSTSSCNGFFTKEANAKPLSHFVRGLYKQDIVECDLRSAYPTIAALWNISPETTAIIDRRQLKDLDRKVEKFVSHHSTCPRQSELNSVMASIYNHIGHVNEVDSSLVIVSLRPEIYVGFLARLMERLVLKRVNRNALMNPFYKKLANVIYGCTGKASTLLNDLYSPQCASAIRSLCRTVMSRTLQNVPPESVLLTQTDGVLLHTRDGEITCEELEKVFRTSIDTIFSDLGNVTTSIRFVVRVRPVDVCLLIDQNQYLVMYSDGETIGKGQNRPPSTELYTSRGGINVGDYVLSVLAKYLRDGLETKSVSIEMETLVRLCFDHVKTLTEEKGVEWFVTTRIPTTKGTLYNQTNKVCWGGQLTSYNQDVCGKRLVDVSIPRFGDTVAVWPVLIRDKEIVQEEFRDSRPSYNTALQPNYVFVMRNFLGHWVKWLFTIRDENQDETALKKMFFAITMKFEREIVIG